MGSSFCSYHYVAKTSTQLNWNPHIEPAHLEAAAEWLSLDPAIDEDVQEILNEVYRHIETVKDGWNDCRNDCTIFELEGLKIMYTGGETWGDSPTDLFSAMDFLASTEIASAIGFTY